MTKYFVTMIVLCSFWITMSSSCLGSSSPSIDKSKCIRMEYSVNYKSPALEKNLVDDVVADYKKQIAKSKDSKQIKLLNDSIDYMQRRLSDISRNSPATYWISANGEYVWQENESASLYRDPKRMVMLNFQSGDFPASVDVRSNEESSVGVTEEMVPFLGFNQPYKVYGPTQRKKSRTVNKARIETGRVPHPYHKNDHYDVTAKYDSQGRLIQLKRSNECYDYRDFRKFPEGSLYPATVVKTTTVTSEIGNKEVKYVLNIIRYHVKSIHIVPAKEVFEPYMVADKGAFVVDHRYSCAGYPMAINYVAGEKGTVDQLSQAFKKAKDSEANAQKRDSVPVIILKALCYFLILLLLGRVIIVLRKQKGDKLSVHAK